MQLKCIIVPDQLINDFVASVVKDVKLLLLVVLLFKYLLAFCLPHKVHQLKQQLTYSQILAYFLPFTNWLDVLFVSLRRVAVLEEIFYFFYFLCHLHHSEIANFPGCFCGSPLQIFSETDNF